MGIEEERKMAKQKRRIMSSDEEKNDKDEIQIMTPGKNVDANNANGNVDHPKRGNSGEEESSWSSDDEKIGKKKIRAGKRQKNNGHDSDSDLPLNKRNRKAKQTEPSSDTSSDELSDDEPRPKRKR